MCYEGRVSCHSSASLPELSQVCVGLVVSVPSRIEDSFLSSNLALQVRTEYEFPFACCVTYHLIRT